MAATASSTVLPMVGVFRGGGFAFGGHVGDEAVGQAGWCRELPGGKVFWVAVITLREARGCEGEGKVFLGAWGRVKGFASRDSLCEGVDGWDGLTFFLRD
jgi:hypothetical protein